MKFTLAAATFALAGLASAEFSKDQPWGKRDYSCINVFQGVPPNATVAAGTELTFKFDRTSASCESLQSYPGEDYKVIFYNNPQRTPDVTYDESLIVATGIPEADGTTTFSVPDAATLPAVSDNTVWYIRLSTNLDTAPQMPSLFNAMGPITITTE